MRRPASGHVCEEERIGQKPVRHLSQQKGRKQRGQTSYHAAAERELQIA